MQIENSVFIVTGGASGLGAGAARLLAAHIVQNPMLNGETIRLDGAIRMQPK